MNEPATENDLATSGAPQQSGPGDGGGRTAGAVPPTAATATAGTGTGPAQTPQGRLAAPARPWAPTPRAAAQPPPPPPTGDAAVPQVNGRIQIADEVVEKVAGLAAIEVPGVADLGGDFARAIESVRERIGIGNKRSDQGVKADVKGQDVTITVTIMVEYGHVVLDVARRVQANVAHQTQRMLGLNVVEVNVTVDDVRTTSPEGEDSPAPTPA